MMLEQRFRWRTLASHGLVGAGLHEAIAQRDRTDLYRIEGGGNAAHSSHLQLGSSPDAW
jgi:hypothetical protein